MYSLHISSASVFAIYFSAAHAVPLFIRNQMETVTLSNCHSFNGGLSSQMGYYPGSPQFPNEQPTVALVEVGGTVVWEDNAVEGIFADGNTFTSHIISHNEVDQGYAGPAENKYGGFYCYNHYQAGIYTDPEGNTCDMIYYCNHFAPPTTTIPNLPTPTPAAPPAEGTVHFDFNIDGTYVTMPGNFTAEDMLGTIDQAFGDPYCDSGKNIKIGDGSCYITYTCHGDVPDQTTKGMAAMLKTVVAKQKGVVNHYFEPVKTCIETNPEAKPGQDPCLYAYVKSPFTQINSGLRMDVSYIPAGNPEGATDQGQLSYVITCPSEPNCAFCKGFSTGLEGASTFSASQPELATTFQGLQFGVDAVCALIGCS